MFCTSLLFVVSLVLVFNLLNTCDYHQGVNSVSWYSIKKISDSKLHNRGKTFAFRATQLACQPSDLFYRTKKLHPGYLLNEFLETIYYQCASIYYFFRVKVFLIFYGLR